MTRLLIALIIVANVALGSAVSSAIDTPVEKWERVVAARTAPAMFQLDVSVRDMAGNVLAQPSMVARLDETVTTKAVNNGSTLSLTASIRQPRDVNSSYNPPSVCHMVNLKVVETAPTVHTPLQIRSMMKLCGEAITLPISDNRVVSVRLQPAPRLATN